MALIPVMCDEKAKQMEKSRVLVSVTSTLTQEDQDPLPHNVTPGNGSSPITKTSSTCSAILTQFGRESDKMLKLNTFPGL